MSKQYRVKCQNCAVVIVNGTACHETGCNGVMEYRRNGVTFAIYRVWALDVLGNTRDGYEVNDRSEITRIKIRLDGHDHAEIRALKRAKLLNPKTHFSSFAVHGDDHCIMIDSKRDGRPLYQLELT